MERRDLVALNPYVSGLVARDAGYETLQDETFFSEDSAGYMAPRQGENTYDALDPSTTSNRQADSSEVLGEKGNRDTYCEPVPRTPDNIYGSVRSLRSTPPAYEDLNIQLEIVPDQYLSQGDVPIKRKKCPTYKCGFLLLLLLLMAGAIGGIIYAIVDATQDDPYPRDPPLSFTRKTTTPMTSSTTNQMSTTSTVTSSTESSSTSTTSTTVPPLGEWSSWSEWSTCSATCEQGEQTRSRECLDENCVGTDTQIQVCSNEDRCSGEDQAEWDAWGAWSECSQSCATGEQVRSRACRIPVSGYTDCPGDPHQNRDCNTFTCPTCGRCPGDATPGCERCICPGKRVTGQVVNPSNTPLYNVTVSGTEVPSYVLNRTDSGGMFILEDSCMNITLEFRRDDMISAYGEASEDFQVVSMQRVEHVVITKEPENKVRRVGEDVTLCCEAYGNPPPDRYEWLKDKILISEGTGTLTLTDLDTDDAGFYQCVASNGYSTARSQEVKLKVTSSACSSNPASHLITLPKGCEQDGVETLDIGKCPVMQCSGPSSGGVQLCDEKGKYCCMAKKVQRIDLQCHGGFSLPVFMVRECGCSICPEPSLMILGQVLASDTGQHIPLPLVLINGTEIEHSADNMGQFTINIYSSVHRLAITVQDRNFNYAETTKILHFPNNPTPILHVNIYLMPFQSHGTTQVTGREPINLAIGHPVPFIHISIPSDSLYTESADPFVGEVDVYSTAVDPRNHSAVMISPGDYSTLTKKGEVELFKTYGMFLIKLVDIATNKEIHIADKVQVLLNDSMVHVTSYQSLLLNRNSGYWEDTGSGISTNLEIEVQVETQTWFVLHGAAENTCYAKVRLYFDNSFSEQNQLEGGTVRTVIADDKRSSEEEVFAGVMSLRSSLDHGDTEGFCIINICEFMSYPYTGYFVAEYEGRILHPAINERDDIGMPKSVSDALLYDAVTDEIGLQSIHAKLTPSRLPANETGPLSKVYDNEVPTSSSTCSNARYSDNHFRFYMYDVSDDRGPWPPYYVQQQVVQNVGSAPDPVSRNWLAWFSESLDNRYSVCYVKVYVENAAGITIGAISQVGNCTYNRNDGNQVKQGDIYGIHQYRPRKDESLCLEVKHALTLTDGQPHDPKTCQDETHFTIGHFPSEGSSNQCSVTKVNDNLAYIFRDKIISHNDRFEFYLDGTNKGQLFGIYCSKDKASAIEARDSAWQMCAEGHDDHLELKKPDSINNDNWAIKLTCD